MKSLSNYVLKGNIIYSENSEQLNLVPDGYLVCAGGKSAGVFAELPEKYKDLPMEDYGDKIIIPGLVDMHTHASQYFNKGLGMDQELLEWLNTYTFPEESKYADLEYAKKAYEIFVNDLVKSPTTRAIIFATIHEESTIHLMDLLEKSKLRTLVGKVNMDRNSPEFLCEKNAIEAAKGTRKWLEAVTEKYENVTPILTPRFIPSCTDELMKMIKEIQKEFGIPVQSHLSENKSEIEWVKELCPEADSYADAYDQFGLFGRDCKTVMAHCVYPTDEEIDLIQNNGVYIALCTESNMNLASGIAPIRKLKEAGINLGLGSDVAGGSNLNMFKVMANTIQASKLYWCIIDNESLPLSLPEVLYFATKGGGSFFGKVGSFEKDYELDAIVIDDSRIPTVDKLGLKERLEKIIYLSDERDIVAKYVAGRKL